MAGVWLRPGLAPEVSLGHYGVAPWLTRTAGLMVFRPTRIERLMRAIAIEVQAMDRLGDAARIAGEQVLRALAGVRWTP